MAKKSDDKMSKRDMGALAKWMWGKDPKHAPPLARENPYAFAGQSPKAGPLGVREDPMVNAALAGRLFTKFPSREQLGVGGKGEKQPKVSAGGGRATGDRQGLNGSGKLRASYMTKSEPGTRADKQQAGALLHGGDPAQVHDQAKAILQGSSNIFQARPGVQYSPTSSARLRRNESNFMGLTESYSQVVSRIAATGDPSWRDSALGLQNQMRGILADTIGTQRNAVANTAYERLVGRPEVGAR